MSPIKYIASFILAATYLCFGYYLNRTDFNHLLILFGVSFALYFFLIFTTKDKKETNTLLWFSIAFRLIFIIAIPFLSDDYFRYIWDGKLFIKGFNPYLYIPSEIVNTDIAKTAGLSNELYNHLNSPDYYSVYPPIKQLFFSIGAFFSQYGMLYGLIAIRIPIIVAEIFTIIYLRKILHKLKLSQSNILLYALNPLLIVELSGNLHFEGMMLCCVVIAIYWLISHRWAGAAIWLAMAVSIKLIPLILLPLLIKRLGVVKSIGFYFITAFTLAFTFLPFLDAQLIQHIFSSIDLYFRTFEFNASVYYVVRWIGYQTVGYNIIEKVGLILPIITLIFILMVSFYRNKTWEKTLKKMLFIFTIYLMMATTIHPWYVINLVLLSVFVSNYKYAIIWSALVVLSYATYISTPYQENASLIWIEYIIVGGWLMVELVKNKYNRLII